MKRPCIALCLFLGAMAASLLAVEMPYGQANVAIAIPPVRTTAVHVSPLLADPDFAFYFAAEVVVPGPAAAAEADGVLAADATAGVTETGNAVDMLSAAESPSSFDARDDRRDDADEAAAEPAAAAHEALTAGASVVTGHSVSAALSGPAMTACLAADSAIASAKQSVDEPAVATVPEDDGIESIASFEDHWLPESMWSAEWFAAEVPSTTDAGDLSEGESGTRVTPQPAETATGAAEPKATAENAGVDRPMNRPADEVADPEPESYSVVVAEEATAPVLDDPRPTGLLSALSNPVVLGLIDYLANEFYVRRSEIASAPAADTHDKVTDGPSAEGVGQPGDVGAEGAGLVTVADEASQASMEQDTDGLLEELAECFPLDFYYGALPYAAAPERDRTAIDDQEIAASLRTEAASEAVARGTVETGSEARDDAAVDATFEPEATAQHAGDRAAATTLEVPEPAGLFADETTFEVEAPVSWDDLSGWFGCTEDAGRCALLDGRPHVGSVAQLVEDARHSIGVEQVLELNAENDGLEPAGAGAESNAADAHREAKDALALAERSRQLEAQRRAVEAAMRPLAQTASELLRDVAESLNGLARLLEQMATASEGTLREPRTAAAATDSHPQGR